MTRLPDKPIAQKHRIISGGFTQRVRGVTDWDAPTPVQEWTARDVVEHLTWIRSVLGDVVSLAPLPAADALVTGAGGFLGKALVAALLQRAEAAGFRQMFAVIGDSAWLRESNGFGVVYQDARPGRESPRHRRPATRRPPCQIGRAHV